MPDDNQTVTEPRSAVEAASDPSHGGSVAEPKTILSACDRFSALVGTLQDVAIHAGELLDSIEGKTEAFLIEEFDPDAESTPGMLHAAADESERLVARLADFVKRAKAAHG